MQDTLTDRLAKQKTAGDSAKQAYVQKMQERNAKIDAVIKVYYDALDTATMIPPSPAGQQIQQAYQQASTDALGGKDPQAALDSAQTQAMNAYDDATS